MTTTDGDGDESDFETMMTATGNRQMIVTTGFESHSKPYHMYNVN